MIGLLVPEQRDKRAPNPTASASAQPGPEGSSARAIACLEAGAMGVAVMGAVMKAADPAGVVAGLVERINRD